LNTETPEESKTPNK